MNIKIVYTDIDGYESIKITEIQNISKLLPTIYIGIDQNKMKNIKVYDDKNIMIYQNYFHHIKI